MARDELKSSAQVIDLIIALVLRHRYSPLFDVKSNVDVGIPLNKSEVANC